MESYIQKYKKLILNSLKSKPLLACLFLLLPISLPSSFLLSLLLLLLGEWAVGESGQSIDVEARQA